MKTKDVISLLDQRIMDGSLKAGERLPTHRDMAWDLKCSVGTVSRAYAELERRGLTTAHVGRGTFVAPPARAEDGNVRFLPVAELDAPDKVDLSLNRFFHPAAQGTFQRLISDLSHRIPQNGYRDYIDSRGREQDIYWGARWVGRLAGPIPEEHLMVTQGAQSAMFLSLGALCNPGDSIAIEAYGYPGIKAAAQAQKLKTLTVEMDEEGMKPDHLASICEKGLISAIVTVPTNHNPTGTTLPLHRRQQIVEIAKKYDIPIIEDGVYAPFHNRDLPTFYELDPEHGIFLTSFSKVFSPGLRVGYIAAAERYIKKLATRMTAMSWMTSPILLDIANQLISSNIISRHQQDLWEEGKQRYQRACSLLKNWLPDHQRRGKPFLSHLWLPVPANLVLTEMLERCQDAGLQLIGGDRFSLNNQQNAAFVRICLMGESSLPRMEMGLKQLRNVLEAAGEQELIS
ncbi:MAG: PLP-dependent aminotransferase family protein [Sneathiella sp.]|nr:PLP-dependent aminotransferase family protein [Sneathiella sp.]